MTGSHSRLRRLALAAFVLVGGAAAAAPPFRKGGGLKVTCTHKLFSPAAQTILGAARTDIRLSGTVTDSRTNAPVPGAIITAVQGGRSFQAVSGKTGTYDLLVPVHRTPAQRPVRCDFKLTSPTTTLVLQWDIDAGEHALKTRESYTIPASLAELVISGQVLTAGGAKVPQARVRATLAGRTLAALTDRNGVFTMTVPVSADGVGRMPLPKVQTFRLAGRPGLARPIAVTCQHRLYPLARQAVQTRPGVGSIRISGTVIDSRLNVPVAGARITATAGGRPFSATSGSAGTYELVVVVGRDRAQLRQRCDFRLQSGMTSVTVKWQIEGGEHFISQTQRYPIPVSLRELTVRGQVLTKEGKAIGGAIVNAWWGGKMLLAQADRRGVFTMTGTCNREGIGQMALPQAQVFRLARWSEPAGPAITVTCAHKLFRSASGTRPGDARVNVRLHGTVIDSHTNTPLPGATVTATQLGRSFQATTDAAGRYELLVQTYRTPLQKRDQCDFRLQSQPTTLTLAWHVAGGGLATTTTGQYTIPASLRELTIRGQVLTEAGGAIPAAIVSAAWGGRALRAATDRNGTFALAGICNPNGIGRMVLSKVQIFRLSRPPQPPEPQDLPGATPTARILAGFRRAARQTRTQIPAAMIQKLEKFLGAGAVYEPAAAGKPLDAQTHQALLQVLCYQIDDARYVAARKIVGLPAAPGFASAEQAGRCLAGLRGLYQKAYPGDPVGQTLGQVAAGFQDRMKRWLGPAGRLTADFGEPGRAARAEAAIEKYLSQELRHREVAAVVGRQQAHVAFRAGSRDADGLRGRLLAGAVAAATFAPGVRDVVVVAHVRGVPIGTLSVPASAIGLLSGGALTPEKFLATWRSTVLADVFAFWQPPGPIRRPGAAGDSRYPPPPPAAGNLQVLYQQCADAYNHLVRLTASKPVDARGLAAVQQALEDYLRARKRYEDALPK